jgi:hypothetical protein
MKGWKWAIVGLAAFGLCLAACCGAGPYLARKIDESGNRGSPVLAQQWRATLDSLGDLEEAKEKERDIHGRRFPNGEWAFGFCRDSHRLIQGAGTLVVKDSRGEARAFFGHVCGPDFLEGMLIHSKSLDEFYNRLRDCGLKEYEWPGG